MVLFNKIVGTYYVLCLCLIYSAVRLLLPPNLKDLLNLVHTTKPYELGLELGIAKSDLDTCRNDCGGQLSRVLCLYQSEDASWVEVVTALCNIREVQSAKAIMNEYVVCIVCALSTFCFHFVSASVVYILLVFHEVFIVRFLCYTHTMFCIIVLYMCTATFTVLYIAFRRLRLTVERDLHRSQLKFWIALGNVCLLLTY